MKVQKKTAKSPSIPKVDLDEKENKVSAPQESVMETEKPLPPEPKQTLEEAMQIPEVAIAPRETDKVRVTMFKTLDPAPTIGKLRLFEEGFPVLTERETYALPKLVAEVLVDSKAAMYAR